MTWQNYIFSYHTLIFVLTIIFGIVCTAYNGIEQSSSANKIQNDVKYYSWFLVGITTFITIVSAIVSIYYYNRDGWYKKSYLQYALAILLILLGLFNGFFGYGFLDASGYIYFIDTIAIFSALICAMLFGAWKAGWYEVSLTDITKTLEQNKKDIEQKNIIIEHYKTQPAGTTTVNIKGS